MLDKITFKYPVNDREYDFNNDELTSLQLTGLLTKRVNDILDFIDVWDSGLNLRELSADISSKRKLSSNGDFTGSLQGNSVFTVLSELFGNTDKIRYIANQFSDGQTGFVIDGGFFEGSGIGKNYSGGRF